MVLVWLWNCGGLPYFVCPSGLPTKPTVRGKAPLAALSSRQSKKLTHCSRHLAVDTQRKKVLPAKVVFDVRNFTFSQASVKGGFRRIIADDDPAAFHQANNSLTTWPWTSVR